MIDDRTENDSVSMEEDFFLLFQGCTISSHTQLPVSHTTEIELSNSEWPTLHDTYTEKVTETDANETHISALPFSDEASQNGDEWELLSSAGSVWTLTSERGNATFPRSFRDAVVLPSKHRISTVTNNCSTVVAPSRIVDQRPPSRPCTREKLWDDHDLLATLRDEYKTMRGGTIRKMYNREHRGRREYSQSRDRFHDRIGNVDEHQRARRSTKADCRRMANI